MSIQSNLFGYSWNLRILPFQFPFFPSCDWSCLKQLSPVCLGRLLFKSFPKRELFSKASSETPEPHVICFSSVLRQSFLSSPLPLSLTESSPMTFLSISCIFPVFKGSKDLFSECEWSESKVSTLFINLRNVPVPSTFPLTFRYGLTKQEKANFLVLLH